jgi:hypothetical protein
MKLNKDSTEEIAYNISVLDKLVLKYISYMKP